MHPSVHLLHPYLILPYRLILTRTLNRYIGPTTHFSERLVICDFSKFCVMLKIREFTTMRKHWLLFKIYLLTGLASSFYYCGCARSPRHTNITSSRAPEDCPLTYKTGPVEILSSGFPPGLLCIPGPNRLLAQPRPQMAREPRFSNAAGRHHRAIGYYL